MTKGRLFVFVLILMTLASCRKYRVRNEIKDFIGQQIVLPDSMRATFNGRDTTLPGFMDVPVKMVILYDSAGCTSCRISHMYDWAQVVATSIGLPGKFNVVFVFAPKEGHGDEVLMSLKASRLGYPVFLDETGQFLQQNQDIPDKEMFHTFLLDRDDRVVLVGNPTKNEQLWELYKDEIKKLVAFSK